MPDEARRLLRASVKMALEGISVNPSAAAVANVQLQALLPFGKPQRRMGSIRMEAEVLQPNSDVTLQSSSINLIAVSFQESPYRSVYYSTLI